MTESMVDKIKILNAWTVFVSSIIQWEIFEGSMGNVPKFGRKHFVKILVTLPLIPLFISDVSIAICLHLNVLF